jgi:1,4-alpha-glucan branching enzyme
MAGGFFSLVLHAHLPFVRHPEDATVMEERWLYEAVVGTYLPLIQVFEGLVADGVPVRATISLSPPLITMLTDDLLKVRFAEHLDDLIDLSEKEISRNRSEPHYQRLAVMYRDRFKSLRHTWRCHEGNLIAAFKQLQDCGALELITATATHAFFPLLDRNWTAMRAQVHTAANLYEKHFGRRTKGMWLGECGFIPGVDDVLREAGVRYFFVDTHAIRYADTPPVYDVYAPVYCPTGVAAFARDTESSEQVWSAEHGYPGDPQYRDFYRDIGFDLPLDYIGPHVHPEGHRLYTGLKYHAITHSQLHDKWVYEPEAARARAGMHAAHFRNHLVEQARRLGHHFDRTPLIVSPYDAELYGHWWFEGPIFLNDLFRQLHHDQSEIRPLTPGDYLDVYPTNQVSTPLASSWGRNGYSDQWLNESNGWIWRHQHKAAERMVELARQFRSPADVERRALNQAARELMLLQSSDWPFIMSTGTTVPYATRRFNGHVVEFTRLYDDLKSGKVDVGYLRLLEERHNIFPDLDYQIYAH